MDQNDTSYSSDYHFASSSSSCYLSTPEYLSQPSYTSSSSHSSSKEMYPPMYKHYEPPSKPGKGSSLEPKTSFSTVRTTYDTTYNKSGSMNNVNGLAARFLTFGDVQSFPFIGCAFDVVWNSPNCGLCWKLTNRRRAPRSILLLLIVPGLVSILHRRLSCD